MLGLCSMEYLHLELFGLGKRYDMDSFIYMSEICTNRRHKKARVMSVFAQFFARGCSCLVCLLVKTRTWNELVQRANGRDKVRLNFKRPVSLQTTQYCTNLQWMVLFSYQNHEKFCTWSCWYQRKKVNIAFSALSLKLYDPALPVRSRTYYKCQYFHNQHVSHK